MRRLVEWSHAQPIYRWASAILPSVGKVAPRFAFDESAEPVPVVASWRGYPRGSSRSSVSWNRCGFNTVALMGRPTCHSGC